MHARVMIRRRRRAPACASVMMIDCARLYTVGGGWLVVGPGYVNEVRTFNGRNNKALTRAEVTSASAAAPPTTRSSTGTAIWLVINETWWLRRVAIRDNKNLDQKST